jgi:hypothetical protein
MSYIAIIIRELLRLGVPVVTGSGNERWHEPLGYPGRFGLDSDPWRQQGGLNELIVVGARLPNGLFQQMGNGPDGVDIYAPGIDLHCPDGGTGMRDDATGTSFGDYKPLSKTVQELILTNGTASPQVAALAAYWKSLRPGLSAADVKRIIVVDYGRGLDPQPFPRGKVPIIWNGIDVNCNSWPTNQRLTVQGNTTFHGNFSERADGPTCSLPGNNLDNGPTLTFTSGPTASPTCLGTGCGKFCDDANSIFCHGPPPFNPDFPDPLDPQSPQNPSNPQHTTPPGTTTATPTTPPGSSTSAPPSPIPTFTNGKPLRYDFLIEQDGSRQDVKIFDKGYGHDGTVTFDLCKIQVDWTQNAGTLIWPKSLTFNYMGTTCIYSETNSWENAKTDDVVGKLACKGFSDGTCFKGNQARGQCNLSGFIIAAAYCEWF